jgi:uncharacterized protein (UPF0248 family)
METLFTSVIKNLRRKKTDPLYKRRKYKINILAKNEDGAEYEWAVFRVEYGERVCHFRVDNKIPNATFLHLSQEDFINAAYEVSFDVFSQSWQPLN